MGVTVEDVYASAGNCRTGVEWCNKSMSAPTEQNLAIPSLMCFCCLDRTRSIKSVSENCKSFACLCLHNLKSKPNSIRSFKNASDFKSDICKG